jgi:hypothetical protein
MSQVESQNKRKSVDNRPNEWDVVSVINHGERANTKIQKDQTTGEVRIVIWDPVNNIFGNTSSNDGVKKLGTQFQREELESGLSHISQELLENGVIENILDLLGIEHE